MIKKPVAIEKSHFVPHEVKFTKVVKGHYLKNNFFFLVGCMCVILAENTKSCWILVYVVLGLKLTEIIGLFFGAIWLCHICNIGNIGINYYNIVIAIDFYLHKKYK
eukprot:TRINITY_DN4870_c0_g1_i9.p1 TRINITY_DN4870_c0_g1~~TRINITY_DN4870_c0_g1_i9.p1  ORF type:complete len:106 (+),score=31.59 TRINITY_DN4870_c0_g1_i9:304-621(+)